MKLLINGKIAYRYTRPVYRHDKPYKRGHFKKTATKVDGVVELHNQGYSIREITNVLHLAKNTIRGILSEQKTNLNPKDAELQKNTRQRKKHQGIITALKGLASAGNKCGYSLETMTERAETILQKYFEQYPKETTMALVGNAEFSVDDLFKKTYEIVVAQSLRLDPKFEEVEKDTFKLRAKSCLNTSI